MSGSADSPFLPQYQVRVLWRRDDLESCDEGRRTVETEVGVKFPGVHVECDDVVSRVRYSEPSKVYHNSNVQVVYVLIFYE